MKRRSVFGNTSSWLLSSLDKFCTLGIQAVKKPELQQSPPIDVSEAFKNVHFHTLLLQYFYGTVMKRRSVFGNTSSWLMASLDKFFTLGIEAVKKPELQQSPQRVKLH